VLLNFVNCGFFLVIRNCVNLRFIGVIKTDILPDCV
jgi:hypothetical protein